MEDSNITTLLGSVKVDQESLDRLVAAGAG